MTRITFVQPDGVSKIVDAPNGLTVMEAAVFNDIKGMYAGCGGDGGCATCQVYVDSAWVAHLPPKSRKEINTLRFAFHPDWSSRLACQINVDAGLEGLIVRMPEQQF